MATNNTKKIPLGWQRVPLSFVGTVVSGATPKTAEPSFWDGSLVWITPKDLSQLRSKYIYNSERKLSEAGFESCSAVKIPPNSLIMSSRAPIGYLAINRVEIATNQGCKSIIPDSKTHVEYLYYYLAHNIDDVKKLGTGSTFAEVGRAAVESVQILLPPLDEQIKIADILSAVDSDIDKSDARTVLKKKLKNGLMQDLLSGRTRVN